MNAIDDDVRERPAKDLHAAEARGAEGLAVKRAFERHEPVTTRRAVLLRELHGELHRHLDGRRAVVAEEDALESGGRDVANLVREERRLRMRDPCERAVAELGGLPDERGYEARMVVTEQRGPPRRITVEVALAVDVVETSSLGPRDDEWIRLRDVRAHLGVRMPNSPLVESDELGAR
jgi:hypothetical protein